MIDIHSHIIHGLDDGAKTFEDTISMINMSYNEGIRSIIATPHYHEYFRYEMEQMESWFHVIVEKFAKDKPGMNFYLGNECYLDENLLEALLKGKCKTLAGSSYVLIEISYYTPTQMAKIMLTDIMRNGYIPIIAHCERLVDNKDDLGKISELKSMGCLFQINSSVLLKPQKRWLLRWIFTSLKNHTISFIASDSHDVIHRRPALKEAYSIVSKKAGIEIANDVFCTNAQKIINSICSSC
jgi:protein-tyrosine phosphatase